ncbi:alkyl sulfatase dimerization domain-containing protein [Brevibacterium oceani]|uniref:alkyl sulfatase dimerization domain-containing protein n=1 Tax=Brevibacterium oceani TaxID=358099 RepID=UPI0015E7A8EE|nr:alkyl sulfatase dimerization domain-containing protein [Brevibacterium oceani]
MYFTGKRESPSSNLPASIIPGAIHLRYINLGYQGAEIAEFIELPPALDKEWSTRGYYGSVSHNVKAIYQRYMGWFDGNPVNLWPHPPQALAVRYVDALGGIERVQQLAAAAVSEGNLRWAATLLGHAVFADDTQTLVKSQLADVLEKLGFGSENAIWRNFYLGGALELRQGQFGTPTQAGTKSLAQHVEVSQLLDSLAIAIEAPKAWTLDLELDFVFEDVGQRHRVTLRNGVLIHRHLNESAEAASVTVTVSRLGLMRLLAGGLSISDLELVGDAGVLRSLLSVVSGGDPNFAIVTP